MKHFAIIFVLCATIFVASGFIAKQYKPTPVKFIVPKGWPKPVYNFKENPLTKEGIELGKMLFYDATLSQDSSTSCASCHQQFAAFSTFDHNLSHGIGNSLTTRNAPALQNLAWQKDFMADGSIHHLDSQPIFPFTNPKEMAMSVDEIIVRIKSNTLYKKMFTKAFGTSEMNITKVTKALSQFMLTLVSSNSKYDKVMQGKDSFILPEKLGYEIFKTQCANCHKEPFFTDFSYRNIGITQSNSFTDNGRMIVTNNKKDSLKFRVPSLRNVTITQPYGHDGRFFTLYNVFEHYRKNMIVMENTDSLLKNKLPLSNYEIGQLTAFLYTLTDTSFTHNKQFASQGFNITPTFRDKH